MNRLRVSAYNSVIIKYNHGNNPSTIATGLPIFPLFTFTSSCNAPIGQTPAQNTRPKSNANTTGSRKNASTFHGILYAGSTSASATF